MRIASLFIAAALASTALHASIVEPVRIDSGLISGTPGESPDMRAFKGIPFAAPPVGNLRWRAPQPVAKWDGVRTADKFSAACMQNGTPRDGQLPFSEDCLYLNVWTAANSATERRPVMMWIYGGGLSAGDAARPNFYGDALAKKGAVIVTINYRVGLMGSFVHPELSKESGHNASGNQALLDMIAALQWIHRNIGAFGGDAHNVTLFGQSSGAGSVTYVLASPLAKGLVQRAICESAGGMSLGSAGFAHDYISRDLATAEKAGLAFAAKAGANSLAELRAKPASELLGIEWNVRANIDGWSQPARLDDTLAAGKQIDVPILAGSNSDEGANLAAHPLSAQKWIAQVKHQYGSLADAVLKLYPAGSEQEAAQSQRNEARDLRAWSARKLLRMANRTGKSKTYNYLFSRNPVGVLDPTSEFPTLSKPGAAHGFEIVYVYNHLSAPPQRPFTPWDATLADMMSSYWVNFAKTGDPNGPGLPQWPAYSEQADLLMNFGDTVTVERSPLKKVIDAVDPYLSAPPVW